ILIKYKLRFMDFKRFFIIVFIINSINAAGLFAQQPVLYFDPSSNTLIISDTPKEKATYVIDLQQPQYATGIRGQCLDLSEDAILLPVYLGLET
ncbi:MAG: hypothetical protein KAK04_17675, partial [Cyclobacteriaceae bacterium]|nr:hypothetical protein [Cyclobacteriaceae bacterium]